ncbi:SUMF1/EgtB/PvdO family nonheme iron enzyme [Paraliomyxa miuraensis]|uniref:SUMF1/EgtB/PvdO family nonheme iron enzyme n=1 Tax=Paraliomyxa miuraensis TaxID=376150 RepID=UPI00224EBB51|nr:SUMF1/EgtB/PvdO family nonheme iron enzyme [Paraliomyxa miuraensis]MCX4239413.1 SUMF1/EgtB/PvdO family nonheme iron enzyme [Paraliomyxa miuraensis]
MNTLTRRQSALVTLARLGLVSTLMSCQPERSETQAPDNGTPAESVVTVQGRMPLPWPDLSEDAPVLGGGEEDVALIVAIQDYDYAPSIPGAIDNAESWHRFFTHTLKVPATRVALLEDEHATRETIRQSLGDIASMARPGRRAWFVFIGHGAPAQNGTDGLLVGADARRTPESLESRSMRHSEVLEQLEGTAAQPIVVLDACFSGRLGAQDDILEGVQPLRLVALRKPETAVVMTAAGADEYAGALPGGARPAFSYLVLGALRGWGDANDDGKVTVSEAVKYAQGAISPLVHGRRQTPEFVAAQPDQVLVTNAKEDGPDLGEMVRLAARGSRLNLNGDGLTLGELPSFALDEIARSDVLEGSEIGAIDMEKEREAEKVWARLKEATDAIEVAKLSGDPTGRKQAKAWCDLAELPDPNPHRERAHHACKEAQSFVEQRRHLVEAMRRDKAIVEQFLELKHRGEDDKLEVLKSFLREYGQLSREPEVIWVRQRKERLFSTGMTKVEGYHKGRWDQPSFYMDPTEVTVSAYAECVTAGHCSVPRSHDDDERCNYGWQGGDRHPINCVSFEAASRYCEWAGKALPTEQQWVWAAQGGVQERTYPWGGAPPDCTHAVIGVGGKPGCGEGRTWAVGSKSDGDSKDGIHDLAGNVREWTQGEDQVVTHGGSWEFFRLGELRNRASVAIGAEDARADVGFRCVSKERSEEL